MFLFAEDEQLCDPVAHAVTDRLYNDDKICKGGPVKKKRKKKPSSKATRGKRKSKKNFLSTKLTWQIKKKVKRIKIFYVITIFYMSYMC